MQRCRCRWILIFIGGWIDGCPDTDIQANRLQTYGQTFIRIRRIDDDDDNDLDDEACPQVMRTASQRSDDWAGRFQRMSSPGTGASMTVLAASADTTEWAGRPAMASYC